MDAMTPRFRIALHRIPLLLLLSATLLGPCNSIRLVEELGGESGGSSTQSVLTGEGRAGQPIAEKPRGGSAAQPIAKQPTTMRDLGLAPHHIIIKTSEEDEGNENRMHHVEFDGGPLGLRMGSVSGEVEELRPDGQAARKGVKVGWYIHAIDGRSQYTAMRMTRISSTGGPYVVTFTEADEPFEQCASNTSWQDSNGLGCQDYDAGEWCARGGLPSHPFRQSAQCLSRGRELSRRQDHFSAEGGIVDCDFAHFAVEGVSARDACCLCGGGLSTSSVSPILAPGGLVGTRGDDKWKQYVAVITLGTVAIISFCIFAVHGAPVGEDFGARMTNAFTSRMTEAPSRMTDAPSEWQNDQASSRPSECLSERPSELPEGVPQR